MNREIGSEFHRIAVDAGNGIKFPRNGSLTFSGRTAIEAVLNKIPQAKTALLPSYCCDSMIEPFRRAGIEIKFFNVNFYNNCLQIDLSDMRADILLWCNYFGFKNNMPDFDGVIIEDITHSLLSSNSHHLQSDYLVASVRKWEPILCGGYCSVDIEFLSPPPTFIENKAMAMDIKASFIRNYSEEKKRAFLSAFKDSNKWLAENYSHLGIDDYSRKYISSVDVDKQREIRRKNASVLYESLRDKVEFMFDEEIMDCPLFVPIILSDNRDVIQKRLAEKKIYCPIHWPHPNAECSSNIYEMELSLICDQRYDEKDMERIASILKNLL